MKWRTVIIGGCLLVALLFLLGVSGVASQGDGILYGPIMWGMDPSGDYTPETLAAFSGGKWSLQHTSNPAAALAAASEEGLKVLTSIGDLNPCRYWNSDTFTFDYDLFMADVDSQIPLVAQYYPDTIVGVSLLNEPHWINNRTDICESGIPPAYLYELVSLVRDEFAQHGVTDILIGVNSHPGYIDDSIGFPDYIEPPGGGQLTEAQKNDGTINLLWIYYHTPADESTAQWHQAIAAQYGWKIIYNTNADRAGTQLVETGIWHCEQEDAVFVTWWSWYQQNHQVPISALVAVREVCDGGVAPPTPTPTSVPPTPTPTTIPPTPTSTPIPPTPTSTPIPPTPTPEPGLVQNGGFETNLSYWGLGTVGSAGAAMSRDTTTAGEGMASAKIDVTVPLSWLGAVQFYQNGISLAGGQDYTLVFWAKANVARPVGVVFRRSSHPWTQYNSMVQNITTSWQRYELEFTAGGTDGNAALVFNLGQYESPVWIDGVALTEGPPGPTPTPTATPATTPTPTIPAPTPTCPSGDHCSDGTCGC